MDDQQLFAMRHSLAHITAQAVQRLWPEAKFGVGPVVDNGFYYDIDLGATKISEDDFGKIEAEMRSVIDANYPFEKTERSIEDAITWARSTKQPYKEELLNDLAREGTTLLSDLDSAMLGVATDGDSKQDTVSFFTDGDFEDLCRGPHATTTGSVGAFKLMRVAGAYWRGNENNTQMQRLYGVAFQTQKELDEHLSMLEEAKKRDHRKLGQELDLFVISDLVGPGLPLFTPRGTVLRNELIKLSEELQRSIGYEETWCPHMTRVELYKASGHFDKYPERFDVSSVESDDAFMMKPMNCPHHTQIYASRPRSYRDLPLRYMETTTMYRDEKSGELHGLSRVRALTQDDSHAFVRHDQIDAEIRSIIAMVKQMYLTLDMPLSVDLSFRDISDKYFGDPTVWQTAEATIEAIAKEEELDYKVAQGEAAFYGPKIDIYVSDALGRRWQCATVQLDFVQPERFELEYSDSDGTKKRPAMIHKAILGSIERFLSVYIEHTAGRFPLWIAPEQVRVIQVKDSEEVVSFVQQLQAAAEEKQIRITVDASNESVGKKIRSAELWKVPYILVIGDREVSEGRVSPRVRSDLAVLGGVERQYDVQQFFKSLENEIKARASKSSL